MQSETTQESEEWVTCFQVVKKFGHIDVGDGREIEELHDEPSCSLTYCHKATLSHACLSRDAGQLVV
eukprot:CAMPEP_0195002178 /NCGR_PEP_ID=MMETSP0326_2-20130528/2277_1 /TAXON_ID=2866 ORGANISM="Crypthecodinium cohnii, Strain Seligo" /NCGR_SAMPLE_ID=MMETSP0326_2 /ASSEMBLY_ACC=CAM_ASM_000348 /LENGTH=66 /DNA_ID=CAMNT_0040005499 /DNA_START=55 /DNA_END=252 /DNA_ORIENTATION=+